MMARWAYIAKCLLVGVTHNLINGINGRACGMQCSIEAVFHYLGIWV